MEDEKKGPPAPKPTAPVAPRRVMVAPAKVPQTAQPAPTQAAAPKPPEAKKAKSPLEDPDNRRHLDHFIFEHAPLIQRQIHKLKAEGKIPSSVDPNDLIVSGVNGIMHAAHRYDPKTGTPFAHFANTHIRSRILDHIVHTGDIPKELMVQAKRFAAYKQRMEAKKQGEAAQPATASPPAQTPPAPAPIVTDKEDDEFFDE